MVVADDQGGLAVELEGGEDGVCARRGCQGAFSSADDLVIWEQDSTGDARAGCACEWVREQEEDERKRGEGRRGKFACEE